MNKSITKSLKDLNNRLDMIEKLVIELHETGDRDYATLLGDLILFNINEMRDIIG